MYKLIIEDDEGKTTVVPLIRDEISIGRKEGNTIRLTERNVSRRHARLLRQNGAVYIEDLSSYNGIKVNGDRITGRAAIGEGDRIQIGDYQLSVKLDRTDQKAVPPAGGAPQRTDDGGVTTPFIKPADGAAALGSTATVPVPVPGAGPAGPTLPGPAAPAAAPAPLAAPTVQSPVLTVPIPVQVQPQSAPERPARIVVISKNFAGQEFPLDKAAVVIGRTEENDVVINHRSISRHHAKIVREGGHYHIVDLQSANGVRVNGEEYGKVELRKGDKIDLGHVRLIFLAPGQDFDIKGKIEETEPGGRRPAGVLAVMLVLLVVVGAGLYFFLPGRTRLDPDAEAAKTLADLDADMLGRHWDDAIAKADSVLGMKDAAAARHEVATVKKDRATTEKRNQAFYDKFIQAGGTAKYDEALQQYGEIPADSVYKQLAKEQYDNIFPLFVDAHMKNAEAQRAAGHCPEFQAEVEAVLKVDAGNLKAQEEKRKSCGVQVAVRDTNVRDTGHGHGKKNETRPGPGPGVSTPPDTNTGTKEPEGEADNGGDANKILEEAQVKYVNGDYDEAIRVARPLRNGAAASRAWRIIGGAACNIRDLKLISDAYKHLDSSSRQYVVYVCQRAGVSFSNGQPKLAE